jgi:hypothetical protein
MSDAQKPRNRNIPDGSIEGKIQQLPERQTRSYSGIERLSKRMIPDDIGLYNMRGTST